MARSLEDIKNELQKQLIENAPQRFRQEFIDAIFSKRLELMWKNMTDVELIQYILPFLKASPEIKVLLVNTNKLGINSALALAAIHSLTGLDIYNNDIKDAGAQALAENPNLSILDAQHNGISEPTKNILKQTTVNRRNNFMAQKLAFLGVMGSCIRNGSPNNEPHVGPLLHKFHYEGTNQGGNKLTKELLIMIVDFNKPKSLDIHL